MDGADEGGLLEEEDAAIVGEDLSQEAADDDAAARIGHGALDDQGFAEEIIDEGVDAPADVVFDDDFLAAGDVYAEMSSITGERSGALAGAGDAGRHSPFLRLAVGPIAEAVGGGDGGHGIAVVGPEAALARPVDGEQAMKLDAQLVERDRVGGGGIGLCDVVGHVGRVWSDTGRRGPYKLAVGVAQLERRGCGAIGWNGVGTSKCQ